MKKKILLLLTIFMTGILSGCGMSEEDAAKYVEASLDAAYKGEFDAFVEITESTPEGAQAMYEENIEHTMTAAGFSNMEISDELTEKFKQLFLELSQNVDYTVENAVKTENGDYEVTVKIHPLKVSDKISEEIVTEAVLKRIEKMDKFPSDKKIVQITFEEIYKLLTKAVQDPEYEEKEVTETIGLHKNEKGMYYISEEDMLELDCVLFNLDKNN